MVRNLGGENSAYLIAENNVITEASHSFCNLSNYLKDELIGRPMEKVLQELLRMDDIPVFSDKPTEVHFFTKELDVKRVLVQKKDGRDPVHRYIFVEIAKSAISECDRTLYKMLEDNVVGIGVYTAPDLRLIKANEKYMYFFPVPDSTKEMVYGKHVWELIHDFRERNEKIWADVIRYNQSRYIKERLALIPGHEDRYWDNTILPVTEDGKVRYVVSMLDDVTDRVLSREHLAKQAETIRIQKEQLEAIFENIKDGLTLVDRDGKVLRANASARARYQNPDKINTVADTHDYRKYFDMEGNELTYNDMPLARVLRGEKVEDMRVAIKNRKGAFEEYIIDFNAVGFYDDRGELTMMLSCDHDITQQVKMEEERKEAFNKIIQMKDEFLSLISHEFKTPITVINSALQTMELVCRDELTEKSKRFLDKIRQNSNRQLKLVNNLLDITRMQAGRLKVNNKDLDIVRLTQTITESINIYAEQKGIRLIFSSTLKSKVIGIDEEKYERILLNLLSNAIKFTPPGKCVHVRLYQKTVNRKQKAVVSVRDEGIGVPADKQALIFEKFGQVDSLLSRQSEGTGIGLSLVKMMVELMNGEIFLDSREGEGSTFTVVLPVEKTRQTPIEKMIKEMTDYRLIQATAIEFSDIYL